MNLPEFSLDRPSHDGQPNQPDAVFYGELDRIGKVVSAHTNVSRSSGVPKWPGSRIAMLFLGAALGVAAGVAAGSAVREAVGRFDDSLWFAFAAVGGLAGIVLFAWLGRPWRICTFVGEDGLERARVRGEKTRLEVLRFDDASECRVGRTKNYVNGVYTGTAFDYRWFDEQQQVLFRINGMFKESNRKPIPRDHAIHFAEAAEATWLAHRLPKVLSLIDGGQAVRFPVGKNKYIDVQRGYVELGLKKESKRLEPADFKSLSLHQGFLTFKLASGGWGSTFRVALAQVGDSKILLALLEKVLGIRF